MPGRHLPKAGAPGSRWRARLSTLAVLALVLTTLGVGVADVVLQYKTQTSVAGVTSPFKFVNGANYAAAHAEGLITTAYPNAQQVSVTAATVGADGAYGTYVLDVLELQPAATSASTWHYHFDVTTALVATGVNAAYVFYCTAAPTTVPDTGAPLASGTDANGNPWAIFAPTCAGTQVSESLTATATGTAITIAGTTAGTSLLFLSFGIAVTNSGATTTTAAIVTLVATTP